MAEGIAMEVTYHPIFDHLEDCQHDGEQSRFEDGRVDERSTFEPLSHGKRLGYKHDLSQRQGIDQGKAMKRKADVVLGQDDRFVEYEESENQPKIKNDK